MVTKRILLFGSSGKIGRNIKNQYVSSEWQLSAPEPAECDLRSQRDIAVTMRACTPDIVINAATLDDADLCQKDPDLAWQINFGAVAAIAAHCTEMNAHLIQLSSDEVFDGEPGGAPYACDAVMNPVNILGESLMMGEEAARHGTYWHVVLRVSALFEAQDKKGLGDLLERMRRGEDISVSSSRIASPTPASAAAATLIRMANALWEGKANGFGTFHFSGADAVSAADFVREVAKAAAPFLGREPTVIVPPPEPSSPLQLPRNTALQNDKITRYYGIEAPDWRTELAKEVAFFFSTKE